MVSVTPQNIHTMLLTSLRRFQSTQICEQARKSLSTLLKNEAALETRECKYGPEMKARNLPQNMRKVMNELNWTLSQREGDPSFSLMKKIGDLEVKVTCNVEQMYAQDAEIDQENFEEQELEDDTMEKAESDEFNAPYELSVEMKKSNGDGIQVNCDLYATGEQVQISSIQQLGKKYQGPLFEELELDMQEAFSDYVKGAGVDGSLYGLLDDFVPFKEGCEYLNWLDSVRKVVE